MSDDVLPAEVLVGGLSPARQARAEQLIREDPAFRAELERLRVAAAAVRDAGTVGARPEPPALDLTAALAARPAWTGGPSPEAGATRTSAGPSRRRGLGARLRDLVTGPLTLRPVVAGLASLLLVGGGVAGGLVIGDGGGDADIRSGPVVPLRAFAGFPGGAAVRVNLPPDAGRQGRLVADGLAPSPAGHFYELWLIGDDGKVASLGSFRVDARGHADIRFAVAANPAAYRYLDVSVEADDGDPGHSAKSVLRSRALS